MPLLAVLIDTLHSPFKGALEVFHGVCVGKAATVP